LKILVERRPGASSFLLLVIDKISSQRLGCL
jgi:hypothetical protein